MVVTDASDRFCLPSFLLLAYSTLYLSCQSLFEDDPNQHFAIAIGFVMIAGGPCSFAAVTSSVMATALQIATMLPKHCKCKTANTAILK